MPALTRRRDPEAREECWHVYYGDVRVGAIAIRVGVPHDVDQWGWSCGFYPGSNPGDDRHGTAASFDAARVAFETAWRDYLPKRSAADFEEWRLDAAYHTAKYARWDARK